MAERYRRFSVSDRLEHVAKIVAFTALAVTGLPQRYPEAGISKRMIGPVRPLVTQLDGW